jgi:hypothetical protein
MPNHQPVSGILTAFNNYELVLETVKGGKGTGKQVIYMKHSIISVEPEDLMKW